MSTLHQDGARRWGSLTDMPPETDLVRVLTGRLDTGWSVIDAETDPARKARLEDHWIDLLRDYEAACDQVSVT